MSGNYIGNNPNGTDYILSDDYRTNNTKLFASTACVNNAVNEIKGAAYLPLGHFFLHPFPTPPDGCLVVNGGEYNRELYKDLFADAVRKNYVKPESEWQSIASANNGYCPWYSDGDGSTTFRTPKFAPYQKLALASDDAGKYHEAGLPNITGSIKFGSLNESGINVVNIGVVDSLGSFYRDESLQGYYASTLNKKGVYYPYAHMDASRSNPIYGNSTTVTPESHDWIVCVVAFGTATNVGEVDVANVMSVVGQVQAGKLDNTTIHLIETWKSNDGTSWYRKWSDGFIEQGGFNTSSVQNADVQVTLPIPFLTINYSITTSEYPSNLNEAQGYTFIVNKTKTFFKYRVHSGGGNWNANLRYLWYACGY